MYYGYVKYELGRRIIKTKQQGGFLKGISIFCKNMEGPVAANFVIFGFLWLLGEPWLYLLWIGSLLTTYNFFISIYVLLRNIVLSPTGLMIIKNTRTIYSNFFEKILFAPHHVNYHAEHHLLMTVPSYNFPAMHGLIEERGFYKKGLLKKKYFQILKLAIKK